MSAMFGLFKKKNTSLVLPKDPLERVLAVSDLEVQMAKDAIVTVRAKGNFEYVARNCEGAVKALLTRVVILHRVKADTAGVRAALGQIPEYLDIADEAIHEANKTAVGDANFIYVSNLKNLFEGAMLAGEWQRGARLANSSRLPVVIDGTGGVSPAYTRMQAAVFGGDGAAFAKSHERYLLDIGNSDFADVYMAQTYYRHDKLLEAISKRDNDSFEKLLADFEKLFLERATDPKYDSEGFLDGNTPESNKRAFDVRATALACFARHVGMPVRYDSQIIPVNSFTKNA